MKARRVNAMSSSDEAIAILKEGGIGVLATDTLYGLVARALDERAVERVYQAKGRNPEKPCIILIADISDLSKFGVSINEWIPGQARDDVNTRRLINQLWPGPVSIVFSTDRADLAYLHRGTGTLAFRQPADAELRELLSVTGPLIAPSANPEGQAPAKTIEKAEEYFSAPGGSASGGDGVVDFYVDSGPRTTAPSTLVEVVGEKVRVLRQGSAIIPPELL